MRRNQKYITYPGSECLLACFQNVLKFYNMNIDEGDVFILGNGLKTEYKKINRNESEIRIRSDVHNSVLRFCMTYDINYIFKNQTQDNDAENELVHYLSCSQPVTIEIDPGYLRYSPIYTNGYGLVHFINIIDFNPDICNNLILISDGFIPTYPPSTYQDWYDYRLLREGWRKNGNNYYSFEINKVNSVELEQKITDEKIFDAIRINMIDYLNAENTGNSGDFNGIKALRQFADDIPDFLKLFANDFTEKMFRLNYRMKIHGLIPGRFLLCKVIKKLGKNICNEKLISSGNNLERITNEWNRISLITVRAGLLKSKESLDALSDRVKTVIDSEERIYNDILNNM